MPNLDAHRHLADLDPRQREVAVRPDGRLLVIAGPGAGKTRALTARIAHLVHVRAVDPRTVVAFTFSRRAAAEIRTRVARLERPPPASFSFSPNQSGDAPADAAHAAASIHYDPRLRVANAPRLGSSAHAPSAPTIWAGTIHAFGVRVLRGGGASHFERRPDFTVYDDDDTDRTLTRILEGLGARAPQRQRASIDATGESDDRPTRSGEADRSDDPISVAARAISLVKRTAIRPTDANVDLPGADFPSVFAAYEEALRLANAFDFDDLVALSTRALTLDRPLRERVASRARHLLVDEFQDTDSAQIGLIEALNPSDLCVVADPQQSIYGFRGASPDVVSWFVRRWPETTVVRLDRNYRSTGRIVAVAQRVRDAAPNPSDDRVRLRQWTRAPAGEPARTWATNAPEREARLIANEIRERLDEGTRPDQIAVLVRTRAQLRPLEAVLVELETVPFEVVGGTPFFGRSEIRDILAYLRLGASSDDAAAFWRIVNVPRRGLGPATVLAIGRETVSSDATSRAPEPAMRRLAARDRLPDGAFDLLAVVDEVRARLDSASPLGDTIRFIVEATRYRDHLDRAHPEDADQRASRVETLATLANRFGDVRRFLDDAALATIVDSPASSGGCVRVSTIHASKGTEYDHVYVAGCEDGLLPIWSRDWPQDASATNVPGDTDVTSDAAIVLRSNSDTRTHATRTMLDPHSSFDPEERRIFYVAVTRARRTLTLSRASFRRNRRVRPSPFFDEVGQDLLLRCEPGTAVPLPRSARTHEPPSIASPRNGARTGQDASPETAPDLGASNANSAGVRSVTGSPGGANPPRTIGATRE